MSKPTRMTVKNKVRERIAQSKHCVFLRSDFKGVSTYQQTGKALRELVLSGELMRIGYGLYAKARVNRITGEVMPDCAGGADSVLIEALERLGVSYYLDSLSEKYMSGQSTQVPAHVKVTPDDPTFNRKITVGKHKINCP